MNSTITLVILQLNMEVIWKFPMILTRMGVCLFTIHIHPYSYIFYLLQDDYTYNMNIYVITCWPEPSTKGRSAAGYFKVVFLMIFGDSTCQKLYLVGGLEHEIYDFPFSWEK